MAKTPKKKKTEVSVPTEAVATLTPALPTFSLEKALKSISERITPEQREAADKLTREGIGRIDPNTPEVERRRLRQLEAAVLEQIDYLETEPDSELKTTRLNVALDRLGEIRADLGDYAGAVAVTRNPRRIKAYREIQAAIDRPAGETCECPKTQAKDANGFFYIDQTFKMKTIETKDGRRSLMYCAACGSMSVK